MAARKSNDVEFKFSVGSNEIEVNGETKYLSEIIWDKDIKYEDIEDKIVG